TDAAALVANLETFVALTQGIVQIPRCAATLAPVLRSALPVGGLVRDRLGDRDAQRVILVVVLGATLDLGEVGRTDLARVLRLILAVDALRPVAVVVEVIALVGGVAALHTVVVLVGHVEGSTSADGEGDEQRERGGDAATRGHERSWDGGY